MYDKGVDCDSGVLRQRPWRWLEWHIDELLTDPESRLRKRLSAAA